MEIHILLASVELGPFSEKQVRQYLADGLISPSDLAKHAGMENWEAVDVVLARIPPPIAVAAPSPPPLPQLRTPMPRAIPKTAGPVSPAPTPPPALPEQATPKAPALEDPAPLPSTQKIGRKSSKIVIQPIKPLKATPSIGAKVRAIPRNVPPAPETNSPLSRTARSGLDARANDTRQSPGAGTTATCTEKPGEKESPSHESASPSICDPE